MTDSKITTRLRPDVDRRLCAAAMLQRARISRVLNEPWTSACPACGRSARRLPTEPSTAEESFDGDHS